MAACGAKQYSRAREVGKYFIVGRTNWPPPFYVIIVLIYLFFRRKQ
jgi:hypothetical protein